MANQFPVELVSVEAKVWSGEADMVVARTTEGELAVLAGHAPLLGELKDPSRVRVKVGDGDEIAYDIGGGFISVTEDRRDGARRERRTGRRARTRLLTPPSARPPTRRPSSRRPPTPRPAGTDARTPMRVLEVIGIAVVIVLAGLLMILCSPRGDLPARRHHRHEHAPVDVRPSGDGHPASVGSSAMNCTGTACSASPSGLAVRSRAPISSGSTGAARREPSASRCPTDGSCCPTRAPPPRSRSPSPRSSASGPGSRPLHRGVRLPGPTELSVHRTERPPN